MIVDPAMLIWLDGNDNTAAAPNENLSREFLELFTLGRGNYTEADVQQAARALSGWRVDRDTGLATLVPARHDDRPTTILGRDRRLRRLQLRRPRAGAARRRPGS